MTLYLIGIGLADDTDITLKGLEAVKRCSRAYLERYTSILQCDMAALEKRYGKPVIALGRKQVEQDQPFLAEAKEEDVALLIVGDVFSATTHISILQEARAQGIPVVVIGNASVVSAVGITGLEVYKFGKVTSIPFSNEDISAPVDVLKMNLGNGLHTLFLLDLDPPKDTFLTIKEAISYLLKKGKSVFSEKTLCIGCARLGSQDFAVKAGTAADLLKHDFGKPPYCLIVPGKLHFVEEEAMGMWSVS